MEIINMLMCVSMCVQPFIIFQKFKQYILCIQNMILTHEIQIEICSAKKIKNVSFFFFWMIDTQKSSWTLYEKKTIKWKKEKI